MRLIVACLVSLVLLVGTSLPVQSQGVADGLAIGTAPPQASAAALLELPNVYVLPGSFWYWVKQVWEDVRLLLAANEQQRAELLLAFSQERLAEGYQAIQHGQAEAAITSLSRYQAQQSDLAATLDQLEMQDAQLQSMLLRLKEQLGLQQALEEFSQTRLEHQPDRQQVSQLLKVQPAQTLVFIQTNRQYLLGVQIEAQSATESAQASSAAKQASPTAQPQP